MNIHIIHRSIRIYDNNSLLEHYNYITSISKNNNGILLIFIFTPLQIDSSINKYFSNSSVQYMIESLTELSNELISKYNSKIYYFYGDVIDVLNSIHHITNFKTLSFNYEYTPYGRKRSNDIHVWSNKLNIKVIELEDYSLFNITTNETCGKDNKPFLVFTHFYRHVMQLNVKKPNKFLDYKFDTNIKLEKSQYYLSGDKISDFYKPNPVINVHGGRVNALKILEDIETFLEYDKERDALTYKTTFLGACNHFGTCSIREIYHTMVDKLGKDAVVLKQVIWRHFFMDICFRNPKILEGQIGGYNHALRPNYDNFKWDNNMDSFEKWKSGHTGFPVVDAAMRQLSKTNYMHNRCRSITASFATKDLFLDWKLCEQYYATQLVDYDAMVNNLSWQYLFGSGTDVQNIRIFNPWIQSEKFDKEAEYIKTHIPELKDVSAKDIHKWYDPKVRKIWKDKGVNYPDPIVEHNDFLLKKITKTYEDNLKVDAKKVVKVLGKLF